MYILFYVEDGFTIISYNSTKFEKKQYAFAKNPDFFG